MKNRLGIYRSQTAPLLEYYGKQGKVTTLDGMAPIEHVTRDITATLDGAE